MNLYDESILFLGDLSHPPAAAVVSGPRHYWFQIRVSDRQAERRRRFWLKIWSLSEKSVPSCGKLISSRFLLWRWLWKTLFLFIDSSISTCPYELSMSVRMDRSQQRTIKAQQITSVRSSGARQESWLLNEVITYAWVILQLKLQSSWEGQRISKQRQSLIQISIKRPTNLQFGSR